MMSYILYTLYNLIYQVFSLAFLFYANTYLNDFFIPENLIWKDGKLREDVSAAAAIQTIILIVEAALLVLLIYFVNRKFLASIAKTGNTISVANWTAISYAIITLTFIAWLMYSIFK